MNKKAELLIEYVKCAPPGPIVEIGAIRHKIEDQDGWSTKYLAQYCKQNNLEFKSFDNDKRSVRTANKVLKNHNLPEIVKRQDGAEALVDLGPIAFLFLDSHKNPWFSLEQYKAAELLPGAILIIDDAQQIDDWKFGKANLVKKALDKTSTAYKIVETIPGWKSLVVTLADGKKSGQL
jgi:predicted O-methyltransferase YrrM